MPPRRRSAGWRLLRLSRVDDVAAAVLGPAFLVLPEGDRLLGAEAYGLDLLVADTQQHHGALDAVRAALAERQVVLAAAAIIAVALDLDLGVGMLHQQLG